MPEEIRDQEKSSLNYQDVIRIAVLYWKWFLLSVIICVGIAAVYLRYTTPVYQATTKMLIKNDDNNARSRTGSRIAQAANWDSWRQVTVLTTKWRSSPRVCWPNRQQET